MDWKKSNRDRVEKANKPGIFAFEERASRLEKMAPREHSPTSKKAFPVSSTWSLNWIAGRELAAREGLCGKALRQPGA